ncbi:complexin-3-like isoform X1 [Pantherophis guttatus]|uniref:Complexin-3-like isoform X1 n=2 Tax=Pantherophis guttatus TaxID=94885 RepID=A0A6P9B041_PANGU|nr:complexin-3-like isoform X1 [Pantherophis guttatus]
MENENIGWDVGFCSVSDGGRKCFWVRLFTKLLFRCFSVPGAKQPPLLHSAPVLTMRSGFGDAVKELLCGFSTDSAKDKDMGVQRSHSWEPVKMQVHPRQKAERDAAFARQKAQRASLRAHLREKYNLPKNPADEKQLEAVGVKRQLPRDLLSIVQPNAANLPSFGGIDFDSLQTTLQSPAQAFPRPAQCRIM